MAKTNFSHCSLTLLDLHCQLRCSSSNNDNKVLYLFQTTSRYTYIFFTCQRKNKLFAVDEESGDGCTCRMVSVTSYSNLQIYIGTSATAQRVLIKNAKHRHTERCKNCHRSVKVKQQRVSLRQFFMRKKCLFFCTSHTKQNVNLKEIGRAVEI